MGTSLGSSVTALPGDASPLGVCRKALQQGKSFSKGVSVIGVSFSALRQNSTILQSSLLKYTGLDIKLD